MRLKGHLSDLWVDRLGDFTITLEENGNTLLTCQVIDQAALHGFFKRVRNLGLPLLSINFLNPRQEQTEEVNT
ncbi:MAG: hypothetical protein CVU42_10375 [Chloroflexi bacterium HGW-Chloroflexi-4]|nr:MAG: hypothetical protein CVU42_10375 [Chloroflexi bacterium HGW-Chloroflexi-4]